MSDLAQQPELLNFYRKRAMRDAAGVPKVSVVHAQAEAAKRSEQVRKLVGQAADGGRKT